ncbi:MAG: methionyl-tRNA formyltransferase [Candidatus Omnitrophica bacterium]|nr:methionyl-tRNA formyltransferase [Candidatus Omnitrophota bacterium]
MKIVFFGTSLFALKTAECIKDSDYELIAVVTQPDRRGGRSMHVIQPPVKEWALENKVALHQFEDLNEAEPLLRSLAADVFVVAAYGTFLPVNIINIPRLLSINVHPSLLPEYRGAAPVNRAIIDGRTETGVTIFKISKQMDAGDIICRQKVKIDEGETSLMLNKRLSDIGGGMVIEALDMIRDNRLKLIPQDNSLATFAPKLKKEDGRIDWMRDAGDIYNLIRGVSGWPGAFCGHKGRLFKIYESELAAGEGVKKGGKAGEVVSLEKGKAIMVKAAKGYLRILKLQLEGKKVLDSEQFIIGYDIKEGDVLTS